MRDFGGISGISFPFCVGPSKGQIIFKSFYVLVNRFVAPPFRGGYWEGQGRDGSAIAKKKGFENVKVLGNIDSLEKESIRKCEVNIENLEAKIDILLNSNY